MRKSIIMGLCAALATGFAVPAAAQDYGYPDDGYGEAEIVVEGHGRVSDDIRRLSQPVYFGDLDLDHWRDREIFRGRVRATANDLCERLGEDPTSSPPVRSCREDAYRKAMERLGTWRQNEIPRGSVLVADAYRD